MKILFGIQGTGNGHLSRSREIVRALMSVADVEVLVSGGMHEVSLGLDVPIHHVRGIELAFGTAGRVGYLASWEHLDLAQFLADVRQLPVQAFDLIISDFEPVTAWAARMRHHPCLAVSHHAAFRSPWVPRPPRRNPVAEWLMRWYAPTAHAVGFHFQPYEPWIQTPIVRRAVREAGATHRGHYTVYLPAFDDTTVIHVLSQVPVRWEIFSKRYGGQPSTQGAITLAPVAADAFTRSLAGCEGLVCGSGFETPAEALHLGKKLLAIPMRGQYEQACNAAALRQMGVRTEKTLSVEGLTHWMARATPVHIHYPDPIPSVIARIQV
jgi:uncharacterized protein (TIGR00661 family)